MRSTGSYSCFQGMHFLVESVLFAQRDIQELFCIVLDNEHDSIGARPRARSRVWYALLSDPCWLEVGDTLSVVFSWQLFISNACVSGTGFGSCLESPQPIRMMISVCKQRDRG